MTARAAHSDAVGPEPILLDRKAVARLLSVSVETVSRRVSEGRLPQPIPEFKPLRWRRCDIEAALGTNGSTDQT